MRKQRIVIDVLTTEDNFEIYKVYVNGTKVVPDSCDCDGLFYSETGLDQYLEDYKDELEVVTDYRSV